MDGLLLCFSIFFVSTLLVIRFDIHRLRKDLEGQSSKTQALLGEIRDKLGK